jgi:AraC-like DNA-binding protein
MVSLTDLFGCITISVLLIIVSLLWVERKEGRKSVFAPTFFALTIIGYLLVDAPILVAHPIIHTVWHVLPFWAPAAFWLFCKWVFKDNFSWRNQWSLLLIMIALLYYGLFWQKKSHWFELPPSIETLARLVPQAISLVFILLGILEALHDREVDLVWDRIRFRRVFILSAATLMIMTALVEISLHGEPPPFMLQLFQRIIILVLVLIFARYSLSIRPGFFFEKQSVLASNHSENIRLQVLLEPDQPLLDQLQELMEKQEYWRNEGLTIRKLAEKMEVKEYRLRQTINQHLGFRNFNDYLHTYRVKRACALLSDPAQRELTILEIAYKMGYASLAPFNKAFRDITGTTPTDWRRQHLP